MHYIVERLLYIIIVPCALSDTSSKGIVADTAAGGNVVSLRDPGWGSTNASELSAC